MLQVEEVSVFYGQVQTVREVSLTVGEGEIVALIGANGAGKTTLLNAISGALRVASGRIVWNGHDITNLPLHQTVKLGIGYVPQGRQLFASLSVMDNLLLGSYVQGKGRWRYLLGNLARLPQSPGIQEKLKLVFQLFPALPERKEQLGGSLSGGEQQMLAIGRALMSDPKLLLLDEPSVGLAPRLVREILGLLASLREQGITILLVEQNAHAALKVADRGYVMEMGRIVAEGTVKELTASDRVRTAYLGRIE